MVEWLNALHLLLLFRERGKEQRKGKQRSVDGEVKRRGRQERRKGGKEENRGAGRG